MARPRKDPSDRCKKWDTLYVTDAERASVTSAASAAGLSVTRYLMSRHAGSHAINRADWQRNVQLLSTVTRQLGFIAGQLEERRADDPIGPPDVSEALQIAISLLEIERLIRDQTMPWRANPKGEAAPEGGDPC